MLKNLRKTALLIFCALFVSAVMVPLQAQAAEDKMPAVKIAEKEGLGRYLTDPEGMTLYYFTKDTATSSACTGMCVERWPIFYSEVAIVPAGCDISDFDVINRDDGKKQTTYKGQPLYYFFGDTAPGDTKGHGVNDVWYVVAP